MIQSSNNYLMFLIKILSLLFKVMFFHLRLELTIFISLTASCEDPDFAVFVIILGFLLFVTKDV